MDSNDLDPAPSLDGIDEMIQDSPNLDRTLEKQHLDGPNTEAAIMTFTQLSKLGRLKAEHQAYGVATITLARYVDRLPFNAKPYAVGQLMREYVDALRTLVPPPGELEQSDAESAVALQTAIDYLMSEDDDE